MSIDIFASKGLLDALIQILVIVALIKYIF